MSPADQPPGSSLAAIAADGSTTIAVLQPNEITPGNQNDLIILEKTGTGRLQRALSAPFLSPNSTEPAAYTTKVLGATILGAEGWIYLHDRSVNAEVVWRTTDAGLHWQPA